MGGRGVVGPGRRRRADPAVASRTAGRRSRRSPRCSRLGWARGGGAGDPLRRVRGQARRAIPLGEGPDLYVESHERLGEYRRRGMVAPVGDASSRARSGSECCAASPSTGKHGRYRCPRSRWRCSWRRNWSREIPADLEGIAALAARPARGRVALAYEAQNPYAHAPILHAFGGRMLGDDDEFAIVGPEAEASLLFAKSCIDAGAVPRDADGALVTNLFRSGQAAFAMSGPWLAADLEDALPYRRGAAARDSGATGRPMRPLLTVEALMLSPRGAKRPEVRALAAARRATRGGAHPAGPRAHRCRHASTSTAAGDPMIEAFARAGRARGADADLAQRCARRGSRRCRPCARCCGATPTRATALEEAEHRFDDVRRPPPPPAAAWPGLVVLSALSLAGAFVLVSARAGLDVPGRAAPLVAGVPLRRACGGRRRGAGGPAARRSGRPASLFAGSAGEIHYVGLANFVDILARAGRTAACRADRSISCCW